MISNIDELLEEDMKQLTWREIQRDTSWLKELPVQVTRYGVVVATLYGEESLQKLEQKIKILEQYIQEQEL